MVVDLKDILVSSGGFVGVFAGEVRVRAVIKWLDECVIFLGFV